MSENGPIVIDQITSKERDGFKKEAHKQITRGRHQLILTMAKQGKTRDEINGVVKLIDWEKELEWVTEELEQTEVTKRKALAAAVSIPIPPSQSPHEDGNAVHSPAS
jgi:hypothetical protein